AARDRAVPLLVTLLDEGQHGAGGVRRTVRVRAFESVPTEVRAGLFAGREAVDLLPRALPDVGDPQVAGLGVEREAPRVPQPVHPDLGPATARHERVVGRDRVRQRAARRGVDAQDLAEQRVARLPVAPGCVAGPLVVPGAAVAEAEVELAVG